MENLRLFIGSRNNHRINTMMVDLFVTALQDIQQEERCNLFYTTSIKELDRVNAAIVFNGETKDDKLIDLLNSKGIPIFYMYDDVDIEIPDKIDYLVSQFKGYKADLLFPVAELLVFHKLWDSGVKYNKCIEHFYGGTFKERRDYSVFNNLGKSMILAGDDSRWDSTNTLASRLPTLRDMGVLYSTMAMCNNTHIVYDPNHYGKGNTLRMYEGAMLGLDVIVWDETGNVENIYHPSVIKNLVSKESTRLKVKGLLWNILQLI